MPFSDYFSKGVNNISNTFQSRLQNVNDLVSNPTGYLATKMGFDNTSTQATTTPAPIENRTVAGPVSPEPAPAPITQPQAAQEPPAAPAAPVVPQMTPPVAATTATTPPPTPTPAVQQAAPQQSIFDRMIQAESGGRHTDRNGNLLTSPRGAVGIAQIMPATAANPGFGVKPLTPEELRDPEKQKQFMIDYVGGMTKYYKGDQRPAIAAYNAGAGRVNKAIAMAQQNGGTFEQYLPPDTQKYLAKVDPQTPQTPQTPQVAPVQQASPQPEAQQVIGNAQHYADLNSNDPKKLMDLVYRLDVPPAITKDALSRLHSDVSRQNMMERVNALGTEYMANNDVNGLTRKMNEKSEEGSYFKAWLFNKMGFDSLAKQEMEKISPTLKTIPVQIGDEHFSATHDATGKFHYAYNVEGKAVDSKTLAKIAAMATTDKDKGHAGATRIRDANNVEWSVVPTKHGSEYYNNAGIKGIPTGKTIPIQGGTDIELQNELQQQKNRNRLELLGKELQTRLEYIPAQEHNKFISRFNAENGTNYGLMAGPGGTTRLVENAPPVVSGQAAAARTTTAGQAAPTRAAPAGQAAPAPQLSPAQLKSQRKAEEGIAKESGKTVAASADTQNLINSIDKTVGILDSGEHNIGSTLSAAVGRGPIAQAIGTEFETKDSVNTKYILDVVNKLATEGLKVLGSNPSEGDRRFWTENKPGQGSSPEFMKMWIESRSADLQRRLAYAQQQTAAGGSAGVAPPVSTGPVRRYNPATGRVE